MNKENWSWLSWFIKRKQPAKIKPVQTITEEKLQQIFLAAPDNPLWNATLAVIDDLTVEITNRAIEPKQPDTETKFNLGGAAALLELKSELLQREQDARRMQAEAEEEGRRTQQQT